MTRDWARIGGWLALVGAALAFVGDQLLLYAPGGGYEDPAFGFMAFISQERLYAGALLGVLAIPLEAAGLGLVYRGLLPAGKGLATVSVALGGFIVAVGTATHACFFYVGFLVEQGMLGEALDLLTPVAGTFVAGFFLLFSGFSALVLLGRTTFPKWLAFTTPMTVYLLSLLTYFLIPPLGNVLLPGGFNLGMFVFFALLLGFSRSK